MSERGTGRTLAMVKGLPDKAVVIVHGQGLKPYVEKMIHDVRPDISATVVVVGQSYDIGWLRGRFSRDKVRVDHAFWECAAPRIQDELRRIMPLGVGNDAV